MIERRDDVAEAAKIGPATLSRIQVKDPLNPGRSSAKARLKLAKTLRFRSWNDLVGAWLRYRDGDDAAILLSDDVTFSIEVLEQLLELSPEDQERVFVGLGRDRIDRLIALASRLIHHVPATPRIAPSVNGDDPPPPQHAKPPPRPPKGNDGIAGRIGGAKPTHGRRAGKPMGTEPTKPPNNPPKK